MVFIQVPVRLLYTLYLQLNFYNRQQWLAIRKLTQIERKYQQFFSRTKTIDTTLFKESMSVFPKANYAQLRLLNKFLSIILQQKVTSKSKETFKQLFMEQYNQGSFHKPTLLVYCAQYHETLLQNNSDYSELEKFVLFMTHITKEKENFAFLEPDLADLYLASKEISDIVAISGIIFLHRNNLLENDYYDHQPALGQENTAIQREFMLNYSLISYYEILFDYFFEDLKNENNTQSLKELFTATSHLKSLLVKTIIDCLTSYKRPKNKKDLSQILMEIDNATHLINLKKLLDILIKGKLNKEQRYILSSLILLLNNMNECANFVDYISDIFAKKPTTEQPRFSTVAQTQLLQSLQVTLENTAIDNTSGISIDTMHFLKILLSKATYSSDTTAIKLSTLLFAMRHFSKNFNYKALMALTNALYEKNHLTDEIFSKFTSLNLKENTEVETYHYQQLSDNLTHVNSFLSIIKTNQDTFSEKNIPSIATYYVRFKKNHSNDEWLTRLNNLINKNDKQTCHLSGHLNSDASCLPNEERSMQWLYYLSELPDEITLNEIKHLYQLIQEKINSNKEPLQSMGNAWQNLFFSYPQQHKLLNDYLKNFEKDNKTVFSEGEAVLVSQKDPSLQVIHLAYLHAFHHHQNLISKAIVEEKETCYCVVSTSNEELSRDPQLLDYINYFFDEAQKIENYLCSSHNNQNATVLIRKIIQDIGQYLLKENFLLKERWETLEQEAYKRCNAHKEKYKKHAAVSNIKQYTEKLCALYLRKDSLTNDITKNPIDIALSYAVIKKINEITQSATKDINYLMTLAQRLHPTSSTINNKMLSFIIDYCQSTDDLTAFLSPDRDLLQVKYFYTIAEALAQSDHFTKTLAEALDILNKNFPKPLHLLLSNELDNTWIANYVSYLLSDFSNDRDIIIHLHHMVNEIFTAKPLESNVIQADKINLILFILNYCCSENVYVMRSLFDFFASYIDEKRATFSLSQIHTILFTIWAIFENQLTINTIPNIQYLTHQTIIQFVFINALTVNTTDEHILCQFISEILKPMIDDHEKHNTLQELLFNNNFQQDKESVFKTYKNQIQAGEKKGDPEILKFIADPQNSHDSCTTRSYKQSLIRLFDRYKSEENDVPDMKETFKQMRDYLNILNKKQALPLPNGVTDTNAFYTIVKNGITRIENNDDKTIELENVKLTESLTLTLPQAMTLAWKAYHDMQALHDVAKKDRDCILKNGKITLEEWEEKTINDRKCTLLQAIYYIEAAHQGGNVLCFLGIYEQFLQPLQLGHIDMVIIQGEISKHTVVINEIKTWIRNELQHRSSSDNEQVKNETYAIIQEWAIKKGTFFHEGNAYDNYYYPEYFFEDIKQSLTAHLSKQLPFLVEKEIQKYTDDLSLHLLNSPLTLKELAIEKAEETEKSDHQGSLGKVQDHYRQQQSTIVTTFFTPPPTKSVTNEIVSTTPLLNSLT
ncbi:MAG: hypothetical protein ACX932_05025 [Gammaproteobacteria bacterium]